MYDNEMQIFILRPHGISSMLRDVGGVRFSVDAAGTRVATTCQGSLGDSSSPFIVIELANKRATSIGTTTSWSCSPSLSPDGSHVVFERSPAGSHGNAYPAIWTAATDGTHLQQLVDNTEPGYAPLWSPRGDRIAYIAGFATATPRDGAQLRLVSTSSGSSTLLVKRHVRPERSATWDTSWSPNGRLFAFVNTKGLLSIVNTATHHVSTTRRPSGQILGIAWSPNGKERLEWRSTNVCSGLWRVPVNGGRPLLISRFCKRR